tara:strand:- start:588 stop:1142 length:555 start_codon:yes stop_codon:yes gene_type:complete
MDPKHRAELEHIRRNLTDEDRIQINELLKQNDGEYVDNTEKIRKLKHSDKIKDDVERMMQLKKKYSRLNNDTLEKMIQKQCSFLFLNYSYLYKRLYKNKLNVKILYEFLGILKNIEIGNLDQNKGSELVGKKLKELYIDSAMQDRKELKEDAKKNNKFKKVDKKPVRKISWKDYKWKVMENKNS